MARDTLEMFETDAPVTTPQERTTPYTNQEAFDIAVAHLRRMSEQSINTAGMCLYRHPDGKRRCAIGALIPDSVYYESMEGSKASVATHNSALFSVVSRNLLDDLQEVHDSSINWRNNKEYMPHSLRQLAMLYHLEWSGWTEQGQ